MNRGLLFWGLGLITAGATALLVQQEYIDRDWVTGAWRLWPLILVVIGLSIILARTPYAVVGTVLAALVIGFGVGAAVAVGPTFSCTGNLPSDLTAQNGTFSGSSGNVTLDFNCGRLDVSLVDGSDWQARTGINGEGNIRLSSTADSLTIRSPEKGFNWNEGKQRWEVDLGSTPTYDLNVSANGADANFDLAGGTFSSFQLDPNAVSMHVDLSGASVDDFGLSMNAGSANISTDADTAMSGTISMNAGSIEFCTAPGAALRFRVNANITFSHNLDEAGLNQSGDTWTSDNFDGADHVIDLRLEGNAASFKINPEGGCS